MSTITSTTTQSQHWVLEKFSRSHAANSNAENKSKSGREEENIEWEHYNQPQLHLQIDTITNNHHSTSRTQQIHFTVSFEPLSDRSNQFNHNYHGNRNRIILTSLDLCSFSSPEVIAITPVDQLPVKAVFKALVVGFRYLVISPSKNGRFPEFRRFQMRLSSAEDLKRLVGTISSVCPVKAATQTTGANSNSSSRAMSSTTTLSNDGRSRILHPVASVPTQRSSTIVRAAGSNSTARTFNIPSLFPNIAASLQPVPEALPSPVPSPISNFQLAKLDEEEFDRVLEEILLDDGFVALVERVQSSLTKKLAPVPR